MPLGQPLQRDFVKVLEGEDNATIGADTQKIIDDLTALNPPAGSVGRSVLDNLTAALAAFNAGGTVAALRAAVKQGYYDMTHQPG